MEGLQSSQLVAAQMLARQQSSLFASSSSSNSNPQHVHPAAGPHLQQECRTKPFLASQLHHGSLRAAFSLEPLPALSRRPAPPSATAALPSATHLFHSWYYASRNRDHQINSIATLEGLEEFWKRHGHPPEQMYPLPRPALKPRTGEKEGRCVRAHPCPQAWRWFA